MLYLRNTRIVMRTLTAFILVLTIVVLNCHSQELDEKKLEIAKKVIAVISENDTKGLLEFFPEHIANKIPEEPLIRNVALGSQFMEEYGVPADTDLIVSEIEANGYQMSPNSKPQQIYSITFPFPAAKNKRQKPERIIKVSFSSKYGDEKIATVSIKEN